MRALLIVLLPLTLLATAPRLSRAQVPSESSPLAGMVRPGTRVRVTTPRFGAYQPVGRYLGMSGDTLLLEREAQETPLRILVERSAVLRGVVIYGDWCDHLVFSCLETGEC